MTNQNKDTEKEFEKLYGEAEVTVTTREGKTEKVKVRTVKYRELFKYLELEDDEAALAEFVTGKEDKWVDNLTDESINAIVDKGRELNHPRMVIWLRRRNKMTEKIKPLLEETKFVSQTFPLKSK